ncbi:MAG: hypothetical protein R2825_17855 [Saprospiraceae bacterium]
MQNDYSYYQESNQFNLRGIALSGLISLFAALLLGYFYTILTLLIPLIYVMVFITIGLGFVMGLIVKFSIKLCHIRHQQSKLGLAIASGLFANYFQWAAFLAYVFLGSFPSFTDYLSHLGWIFSPKEFFMVIHEINKSGMWSLFGVQVNGLLLAIIWIFEFAIILAVPILMVFQTTVYPYSEKLGKWYKKYTLFDDFEPIFSTQQMIPALQTDALSAIKNLQPGSGWRYSKIHILYLEEEENQYLSIEKFYIENRGAGKKNQEMLINNLSIDKRTADLIMKNFKHKRENFDVF